MKGEGLYILSIAKWKSICSFGLEGQVITFMYGLVKITYAGISGLIYLSRKWLLNSRIGM